MPLTARREDLKTWHLYQEALRKGLWLFAIVLLDVGFVGRQREIWFRSKVTQKAMPSD